MYLLWKKFRIQLLEEVDHISKAGIHNYIFRLLQSTDRYKDIFESEDGTSGNHGDMAVEEGKLSVANLLIQQVEFATPVKVSQYGILSFVYKTRKPFHPHLLIYFINFTVWLTGFYLALRLDSVWLWHTINKS